MGWNEWETMNDTHTVHTVLIEWDGNRPPTKWYNRLLRMGLHVAGDKQTSPLARRASGRGVIHQEGAILVESESEARILAHMARACGATAVTVGLLEIHETNLTSEDMVALNRIQKTLGKRGRPSEQKSWVVTCADCLLTEQIESVAPVHCNNCGSFSIQFREGVRPKVQPITSTQGNLFKTWEKSRFLTGGFEIPEFAVDGVVLPLADPVHTNKGDDARAKALATSPVGTTLLALLNGNWITLDQAMRALDEAWRATGLPQDKRQAERLRGLSLYFVLGGQQDGILLTTSPDRVDILDILARLPKFNFAHPLVSMGTSALGLTEVA